MRSLLLTGFFLFLPGFVSAQTLAVDDRELFQEGEYFFVRGDYSEAAYYFRKLVDGHPENGHYNFKLGECYMNIPGSEIKAIPCFEKATLRTVEKNKYKGKDFGERNAPLHAWFYLGNVYRIGGRLDDALNAYNMFINSPFYYGNYNVNVVENGIKSCERAKIIMDSPIDVVFEALDTVINTAASERYPAIDANQQTMVFLRKLKFYDAMLWVSKQGDSWGKPVNINPLVGSDGDFYPVTLSPDGNELYMVKTGAENKDLFVSYRRDGTWTKAEPLNNYINSGSDETWATISADGKTLWFTSARKGGLGGTDIYYSHRDQHKQWGKARNAGKIINTPFDEESPYFCSNDQILFFSSVGHYSMGGFDVFYTSRKGKTWKDPVNIGYPINSTSDDTGFVPASDGRSGHYSVIRSSANDIAEDIYRVVIKSNFPLP